MTDGQNNNIGLSPALWVIAAIMFLGAFNREGFGFGGMSNLLGSLMGGSMFGGPLNNMYNQNFANGCINDKSVLDAVIATTSSIKSEINSMQDKATANWYNTNQHIDNIYMKQQEEKVFDLKTSLLQKDNQIQALQNQMIYKDEFNKLQERIAYLDSTMLKAPEVRGCGCFPAPGNRSCMPVSTGTAGTTGTGAA